MRHLIYILWVLLLTSCGTTYQLSTLNNNDPIYGIVESTGDTLKIDVIDNEFQLDRKFRFDDKFRWDFAQYAMNQDLRWHYDFYWNNRMYRSPFASPFDFYWNSHQYWWNWSSNYSFNYGFNHWNRYDSWRWGYGHPFYNNGWRNQMNDYAWENRNRRNVAYVNGRRGSNIVVTPNGSSRGGTNNIISNPNIRINRGRTNVPLTLDNEDLVIKDRPNLIDRFVRKIENSSGIRIRTYENPNNVPNNNNRIRNYNRTNNNNIRNYNVPRNNPNPPRVSPSRSSSPPTVIRSNSSRSSGGVSVSRGSNRRINN